MLDLLFFVFGAALFASGYYCGLREGRRTNGNKIIPLR